jgi:hypothetical protein
MNMSGCFLRPGQLALDSTITARRSALKGLPRAMSARRENLPFQCSRSALRQESAMRWSAPFDQLQSTCGAELFRAAVITSPRNARKPSSPNSAAFGARATRLPNPESGLGLHEWKRDERIGQVRSCAGGAENSYFTSRSSFSLPALRSSIFFVSECVSFSSSSRVRFCSSWLIFFSFSSLSTASLISRRILRTAVR